MSALAEALLAAQRQAVGVLAKQFVAGNIDAESLAAEFDRIGLRDDVDQGLLIDSLEIVKAYGGEAPAVTGQTSERKAPEAASSAQLNFITKLCREKNVPEPDIVTSKDQASEIISALQAGTYNADKYDKPF